MTQRLTTPDPIKACCAAFLALLLPACQSHRLPADTELVLTPYSQLAVWPDALSERNGRSYLGDTLYTGVVFEAYPDGTNKLQRSLLNGQAHGVWLEWYPGGALRYYGEWRNGLGNGPFLYFHPNGQLRERAYAENDIWVGVSEGWREDGTKEFEAAHESGKRHLITKYDENGVPTE